MRFTQPRARTGAWPTRNTTGGARTLLYTPKTREELSYLIGIRPPSRGGGYAGGYCLDSPTMNWWTMEFVVVDVGATLVLLLGYLALMLRKAVL